MRSPTQWKRAVQQLHRSGRDSLWIKSRFVYDQRRFQSTSSLPPKADLQALFTKLRNKVADAGQQLPPGAQVPFVNDDFGDVYGLYYLITGDGYSMRELEDYAKSLRGDLLTVEGVGKVSLNGAQRNHLRGDIAGTCCRIRCISQPDLQRSGSTKCCCVCWRCKNRQSTFDYSALRHRGLCERD